MKCENRLGRNVRVSFRSQTQQAKRPLVEQEENNFFTCSYFWVFYNGNF